MLIYEKKVEDGRHLFGTLESIPSDDDNQIEVVAIGEPTLEDKFYDDGHGGIIDADGNSVIIKIDGVQVVPRKSSSDDVIVVDPEDPEGIINAIAEAIAAGSEVTVQFIGDTTTYGVSIPESSVVTLDLNGYEYDPIPDENGDYAGSTGTKTQAIQLLKDSTIVIKNGTITGNSGSPATKMVIQNYSNLTLDNVVVQDAGTDTYVLSNNFGEIHLKNGTQINAVTNTSHVAFDCWYGMASVYDEGVKIYIDTADVVINGPIEYGHASRITDEDVFMEKAQIYVCADYDINSLTLINSTSGSSAVYAFVLDEELGYYKVEQVLEESEGSGEDAEEGESF